jgi:hypothetical protein
MRPLGAFLAVFAIVLAVLFAAVGQLGKIDRQTLVAVLVAAAVAAGVAALRARRREP